MRDLAVVVALLTTSSSTICAKTAHALQLSDMNLLDIPTRSKNPITLEISRTAQRVRRAIPTQPRTTIPSVI